MAQEPAQVDPEVTDDEYSFPLYMVGSAHALNEQPPAEDDAVRKLHEAVLEVTGQPVAPPAKPRIGFLP